jgi:Polyketide synthase dehydratase
VNAFNLKPITQTGQSIGFRVELRASEPFLDHHRPGGRPLFGTVMGIELMCRAATVAAGATGLVPARLSDVTVLPPIILHAETAVALLTTTPNYTRDGKIFDCTITTQEASTEVHFTASILLAEDRPSAPCSDHPGHSLAIPVKAEAIYSLFFHGPAFQVIAVAGLLDDTMHSRLATGLPALSSGSENSNDAWIAAPRLIEACLQTAGLLDIATRSRMMIPHRIDDIEFYETPQSAHDHFHAIARRATSRSGREAIDIDLRCADGPAVMRVCGYETRPLPFETENTAIVTLRNAFRGHANQT